MEEEDKFSTQTLSLSRFASQQQPSYQENEKNNLDALKPKEQLRSPPKQQIQIKINIIAAEPTNSQDSSNGNQADPKQLNNGLLKLPDEENKEVESKSETEKGEKEAKDQPSEAQKPRLKKKLTKMNTMSNIHRPEPTAEKKEGSDTLKPGEASDNASPPKGRDMNFKLSVFMSPKSSPANNIPLSAEEKEAKEKEKKKKILSILELIAGFIEKKDDGLYGMSFLRRFFSQIF